LWKGSFEAEKEEPALERMSSGPDMNEKGDRNAAEGSGIGGMGLGCRE